MTSHTRARRYLLTTLALTGALGIVVYLIANIFGGDRGLSASRQMKHEVATLHLRYAALERERHYLQTRVDALDPNRPDLDMLGEQARRVLFFSEPGEFIVKPPLAN